MSLTFPRRQGLSTLLTAVVLFVVLLVALLAAAPSAGARTPPPGLGGFQPGNLITDSEMFDGDRLTVAQIDQRLRSLGSACNSGTTTAPCLKDLRLDAPARPATAYCAAVPARTAAASSQLISDVAVACDVNPQVILVKLQKEQGLVTTTSPTWERYDKALGYSCPDFERCDPRFSGFVHQLYHASSRLQEYGDPARRFTFTVGAHQVSYSPDSTCGKGAVHIANRATAALYNYTPFTPTQASLDAGQLGVPGDPCAAYGNRNFFRLYSLWFGTPNGTDGTAYPVAAPNARPFTDIVFGVSPFFTEISWMKETGMSAGYPDGSFRPTEPLSREAMAAFLYRAAGSPAFTPPAQSPFRDVAPGAPFYGEITWLHSTGITAGWTEPDGTRTFRPSRPIARDALAAFLYRAAGSPSYSPPGQSPFQDIAPGASFYREITWLHSVGITAGWTAPDGTRTFRPSDDIQRQAVAAFLYRWSRL